MEHFKPSEFVCKCGQCKDIPPALVRHVLALKANLDRARKILGKPIIITSGIRCAAHNKSVGGAPQSMHLEGKAVDIKVDGMHGLELRGFFLALIRVSEINDGGLGAYADRPEILHYDIGPPRQWSE